MCKNCQKWLSHFINVSICVAKTLQRNAWDISYYSKLEIEAK